MYRRVRGGWIGSWSALLVPMLGVAAWGQELDTMQPAPDEEVALFIDPMSFRKAAPGVGSPRAAGKQCWRYTWTSYFSTSRYAMPVG